MIKTQILISLKNLDERKLDIDFPLRGNEKHNDTQMENNLNIISDRIEKSDKRIT